MIDNKEDFYKVFFNILKKQVEKMNLKYKVLYSFVDTATNLKNGFINFQLLSARQEVSRSEHYNEDLELITTITEAIEIQVNVARYIDYTKEESNPHNIANNIYIWLNSNEVLNDFANYGYELVRNWRAVNISGHYDELKKWYERAFFNLKFYTQKSIKTNSEPLENYKIEIMKIN